MPDIAKKFYPEIQGIRAISILAVILFHFGAGWLPGGYVGVDMFFVVSGYLITKMIVHEINAGTFTLRRFYRNRVIRLLPNLFLMVVASLLLSYWVLKPYDFSQYAKSLQFSAIYVTNMVFARQQGYFDMSRDVKPLLHTWSLSIEEQFYLVFPLILILLHKLRSHRIAVLLFMAGVSLWVRFNYIQEFRPTEGFFSFLGRIWEFVVGALLVLMPVDWRERFAGQGVLAFVGLMVVVCSLLFLEEGVPYSGVWLLAPCLATALLIVSSPGTACGRGLGMPVMVFIGGISYSLYLWHWPLMVWLHNADTGLSRLGQEVVLLGITLSIAYFAWRYVEEPFRQNRERFSGRFVGGFVLSFAVFCGAAGGYVYAKGGMEERFPAWVEVRQNLESFDFEKSTGVKLRHPVYGVAEDPAVTLRQSTFGDMEANRHFLVLGDSHAVAWYPAFEAAAQGKHWQGVLASLPGCPPVFGIKSYDGAKDICEPGFDRKIEALLKAGKFEKVFLVAYWGLYSEGAPEDQPNHFISDMETVAHDAADSKLVLARHLEMTIQRIKALGIQVIIVRSVPVLPKVVQALPAGYELPVAEQIRQQAFMMNFLSGREQDGVISLDPTRQFCDDRICRTRQDGRVLYNDDNHISPAGAAKLIDFVKSSL